MPTRAEIEARRGIERDEQGRIVRSTDWIQERIELLKSKIEDYTQRIKNAQAEISQREAEIEEAE